MKITRINFWTPNFTFEAYGKDKKDAFRLLKAGWKKHCTQYVRADKNYLNENLDSINYLEFEIGNVVRDGEIIIK